MYAKGRLGLIQELFELFDYKTYVWKVTKQTFEFSRVKLRRLSASTVGFRPEVGEDDQHTLAVNQFGQTILEEEELTVHWQQKFFSQVLL